MYRTQTTGPYKHFMRYCILPCECLSRSILCNTYTRVGMIFVTRIEYVFVAYTYYYYYYYDERAQGTTQNITATGLQYYLLYTYDKLYYIGVCFFIRPLANGADKCTAVSGHND